MKVALFILLFVVFGLMAGLVGRYMHENQNTHKHARNWVSLLLFAPITLAFAYFVVGYHGFFADQTDEVIYFALAAMGLAIAFGARIYGHLRSRSNGRRTPRNDA